VRAVYRAEIHLEIAAREETATAALIGVEEIRCQQAALFGRLVDQSLASLRRPGDEQVLALADKTAAELAEVVRGRADLLAARRYNLERAGRLIRH
jgi:hypothetical protein